MADDEEYETLSSEEIDARIRALEALKRDIENAADEQGNISFPAGYRLIDKWNRSVKYRDKDVFELGQALDVPKDWYNQLTVKYGRRIAVGHGVSWSPWPARSLWSECSAALTSRLLSRAVRWRSEVRQGLRCFVASG